jgi:hypothetical protein
MMPVEVLMVVMGVILLVWAAISFMVEYRYQQRNRARRRRRWRDSRP